MKLIILLVKTAILTGFLLAPITSFAQSQNRPLEALATQIPIDAQGFITLSNLEAIKRHAFFALLPIDADTLNKVPFSVANIGGAFDRLMVGRQTDGGVDEYGFSIFAITQMAGWGNAPELGLVMLGVAQNEAHIDMALRTQDFQVTAIDNVPVWSLGEDFRNEIPNQNTDPFSSALGHSQRFAVKGQALFFAHNWAQITRSITSTRALSDDPDMAALLFAGYELPEFGEFTEAIILRVQPERMSRVAYLLNRDTSLNVEQLLATIPGSELAALPRFQTYALMQWQAGARMTGAIGIPFADLETAMLAQSRIEALLAVTLDSRQNLLVAQLAEGYAVKIIESNNRAVLVVGFTQRMETSGQNPLWALTAHPANRLLNMVLRRDLDMLIGYGDGS